MKNSNPNPSENQTDSSGKARPIWFEYLRSLPFEKGSLDDNCYRSALRAASLGVPEDFVFETLCARIEEAGDQPKKDKIWSQIHRANAYVHDALEKGSQVLQRKTNSRPTQVKKPGKPKAKFCPDVLARIAAALETQEIERFITSRSPLNPDYISSNDFLMSIYHPGEKVLVFSEFKSQGQVLWDYHKHKDIQLPVGSLDGVWFLANPVDGNYYANPRQGGKLSRRSEESITSFRFVLLESDQANTSAWLKLLAQAPLQICAIYSSGGRSIHALVRIDATSKSDWDDQVRPYKAFLTMLGADPGALSAVRLSRLPQAFRGEILQRLIYFEPSTDGTPICAKVTRPFHYDWLQWANCMLDRRQIITREDADLCRQVLEPFAEDPLIDEMLLKLEFNYVEGKDEKQSI
jgi:hypothetical protein